MLININVCHDSLPTLADIVESEGRNMNEFDECIILWQMVKRV